MSLGFSHLCGLRRLCRCPLQALSPVSPGRARGHGRQRQGALGGGGARRPGGAVRCAWRCYDPLDALVHEAGGVEGE